MESFLTFIKSSFSLILGVILFWFTVRAVSMFFFDPGWILNIILITVLPLACTVYLLYVALIEHNFGIRFILACRILKFSFAIMVCFVLGGLAFSLGMSGGGLSDLMELWAVMYIIPALGLPTAGILAIHKFQTTYERKYLFLTMVILSIIIMAMCYTFLLQ